MFFLYSSRSLLETIPRVNVRNVETIEACTHEVSFYKNNLFFTTYQLTLKVHVYVLIQIFL